MLPWFKNDFLSQKLFFRFFDKTNTENSQLARLPPKNRFYYKNRHCRYSNNRFDKILDILIEIKRKTR
jgi:hypothetical protein